MYSPQPPSVEHLADLYAVLRRDLDELRCEIEGPLVGVTRLPLRDRVHILESSKAAQSAAESALSALRAKDEARGIRRYARWIALAGLAITVVNVALSYALPH